MTAEPVRDSPAAPPPVAVTVAGAAVRRVLATSRCGTVLAVFRRALYVADNRGGLLCIGPRSLGAGPLNVLCADAEYVDWQALGPAPGTPVDFDRHAIQICGGPAFSLNQARDWHPPGPIVTPPTVNIVAGLGELAAKVRERAPTAGVAPLLAAIATRGFRPPAPAGSSAFLRAAVLSIAALNDWLVRCVGHRESAVPTPPPEAAVLVGLGPGLTPSGDDFIGGALIALRYLSRDVVAGRLAGWALPLAVTRTGAISRAHLACAAEGAGAGALHELLAAVCAADVVGIAKHLAAIDAIGHCSGWDALAGVAAACASVVESGDDP